MAAYIALADESQFDNLRLQVKVALSIECNNFFTEPPGTVNHANRVAWAQGAIADINGRISPTVELVLAANASATVAQIQAATDAQVQTAVHNAIVGLVGG